MGLSIETPQGGLLCCASCMDLGGHITLAVDGDNEHAVFNVFNAFCKAVHLRAVSSGGRDDYRTRMQRSWAAVAAGSPVGSLVIPPMGRF
ncbi:unnamed protein product [Heligmosomoides polygyrus]|uniref:Transposase n=1 Tax=Heligmosomoides polygyrus TaxID=6339 RepID=A0A183FZF1_HELPZ|nr:unnamed protein product [Heligmosomoides polygyrus]